MAIIDTVIQTVGNRQPDSAIRTIACDAVECTNTITFDRRQEQQTYERNPWMKEARTTQTADGRVLVYCSDECEVKGVSTGKHNLPKPQVIVEGNAAVVAQAAAQAAAAKAAEQAIRDGKAANIQITD